MSNKSWYFPVFNMINFKTTFRLVPKLSCVLAHVGRQPQCTAVWVLLFTEISWLKLKILFGIQIECMDLKSVFRFELEHCREPDSNHTLRRKSIGPFAVYSYKSKISILLEINLKSETFTSSWPISFKELWEISNLSTISTFEISQS